MRRVTRSPRGDVSLSSREIGRGVAHHQVDAQLRVLPQQGRQHRWHDVERGQRLGQRKPHHALHQVLRRRRGVAHASERAFDHLHLAEHPAPQAGEHEARRGAVEERAAQPRFERGHPPAHGRLLRLELASRRPEATVSRGRQKEAQIVPVQGFMHECMSLMHLSMESRGGGMTTEVA
jgi:hypothetical protein